VKIRFLNGSLQPRKNAGTRAGLHSRRMTFSSSMNEMMRPADLNRHRSGFRIAYGQAVCQELYLAW
jgi:hypothetical protein